MPPKYDQLCSQLQNLPRTLPRKADSMKGLPFVLAFTAMTFIAWGAYGPLLHHGTLSMGNDSLRAFVGVGIAYFFIAVLVPIYILRSQGEAGKWTISGTFYSLFAGSVGALGALGVILALAYGGSPIYVMPLVFGFAPIVNTLVTAWMSKTFDQISPVFIGGIVVAALGVAGVLAFKPAAPPHAAHPTKDSKSDDHDDKKSSKKGHAFLERSNSIRFVSSVLVQEPAAQDPLPPVVVQPAAPEPAAPTNPVPAVAPQAEPKTEAPQELPPVVVQPTAPAPTTPAPTTPAPTTPAPTTPAPTTPASTPTTPVQEPAQELPPVVVQPEPLKQADAPTAPTETPKVEAPKPEATKPEATKPEPAKPEPAKPETTKPETTKPEPAKPEPAKLEPAKPEPAKPEPAKPETIKPEPAVESAKLLDEQIEDKPEEKTTKPSEAKKATVPDVPMIILSIIVAAICWGSYGPMLHQGQARMGGSRLRPFTCVGLAYFFIAVAAPIAVIYARTADTGSWSVGGLSWSIVAGAAGAIGALGVILAFNAGGKPYYVMPLVFGFAPVINTCISLTEKGTWGQATTMFWISLAVVIAGAITVLLNAPKPKHAKPAT